MIGNGSNREKSNKEKQKKHEQQVRSQLVTRIGLNYKLENSGKGKAEKKKPTGIEILGIVENIDVIASKQAIQDEKKKDNSLLAGIAVNDQ